MSGTGIMEKLICTWVTITCVFLSIFVCRLNIWIYNNMLKEELRNSNKSIRINAMFELAMTIFLTASLIIATLLLLACLVALWFF